MFLHSYKITRTMPSIVRNDWMGVWAELSDDVSDVLPYLNALIENAAYIPQQHSLTIRRNEKVMTISPREISIAQATSVEDGRATLDELRDYINEIWDKRETITPLHERRELKELKAGDVAKLLPQTNNCRECGLPSCFAFAMALIKGQKKLKDCPALDSAEFAANRQTLTDMLRTAGRDDTAS
jgi:ArsR family metal-binding transcriptional regulator